MVYAKNFATIIHIKMNNCCKLVCNYNLFMNNCYEFSTKFATIIHICEWLLQIYKFAAIAQWLVFLSSKQKMPVRFWLAALFCI